jgi:hypothetical protein
MTPRDAAHLERHHRQVVAELVRWYTRLTLAGRGVGVYDLAAAVKLHPTAPVVKAWARLVDRTALAAMAGQCAVGAVRVAAGLHEAAFCRALGRRPAHDDFNQQETTR